MTGRLAGRVAIITGGGDGIGAGLCRRFAEEGAQVVVAELSTETGPAVAEQVGGLFVPTDVADKESVLAMVQATVDAYGRVDILIDNAWGGGNVGRVENKTDEMIYRGFSMGFMGPLWAMQASFPHMRAAGWGRVVNMCSLNGVNAHMGTLEYNISKEALRTLTRTAAREWAPTGVTVNAICPGARSASTRRMIANQPELEDLVNNANPMGRMGDPYEDIAPAALFFSSEDCRYVTGNTMFVDGGGHINGVAWVPDLD